MKKAKAPRVPVLENAFEVNLPKLMRAAKATGSSKLVLDDGDVRTVAVLTETHLAVFLGRQQWVVDIVPVQCLQGRVRPLLKCPRAHEGNFMSLYYHSGELACRHCHMLRYRSTLASSSGARIYLKRIKIARKLGTNSSLTPLKRRAGTWRKTYLQKLMKLSDVTQDQYSLLRATWKNGNTGH